MNRKVLGLGLGSALCLAAVMPVQASEALFKKGGCVGCHMVDKKMVGPALKDIAAKYKGQGDAVANLSAKLRKGGVGVWGTIPMPASGPDKISDAELKTVMQWVLSQ
jgi:cytochrome c